MSTHPGMLLAYDASGNVVGTLDYCVQYADDHDRTPLGLVDFAAHENAGGDMTEVWIVDNATGSKTWPEYLGIRAHDFTVELIGPARAKHINALVHKVSGFRRERAIIEAAIADRITAAGPGGAADIRDLVGGPNRPLNLDETTGLETAPRPVQVLPALPLVQAT